jgi:MoaA/NifB/PqqE/SkfB family radical SAM enzyme
MIFNPQLKLAQHEEFSKHMRGEITPIISFEISPSSICNAKCPWCFYRNDKNEKKDFIDGDKLADWLYNAWQFGLKAVSYTGGGEPTLHPGFSKIIKKIFKTTRLDQGLFTNALKKIDYDASFLKWIRVSKTDKDFPEESIRNLRQMNPNVGLCVNYQGIAAEKDCEIGRALELSDKYDLKYVQVRPALNLMGQTTNISAPPQAIYSKHKKLIAPDYKYYECVKDNRGYDKCEGFRFSAMIWEDGTVSACMYMRHNHAYDFGNIYEKSFCNILHDLPKCLPVAKDCQVCCKNNEINKLISDSRKLEDVNFI